MLKGDLTTTPLETVLTDLAAEEATGCLHVIDDDGDEALIYVKSGLVYAVSVPGQRPQLGSRLISSNALVPENLAEALEAQRTELQGWRLGELLVHLGFVEQDVVEAFVQEQVRDGFTDLMAWTSGRWRFRKGEKTREDVAPPTPLETLLDEVHARRAVWEEIVVSVHGPNAVPMLAARGGEADITLDPDTWSLLCKIDGERSIAELARECGFTLFEAGTVVRTLVEAGLVDVDEDISPDDDIAPVGERAEENQDSQDGEDVAVAQDDDDEFPRVAALAAAFALGGGRPKADTTETVEEFEGRVVESDRPDADSPSSGGSDLPVAAFAGDVPQLARVSEAFARAAAPSTDPSSFVDPFHVPDEIRLRPSVKPKSAPAKPTEDDLRRERIRQAAAEELAAAHAEAEAMRKGTSGVSGHIAEVVNLEARREAAKVEAERREAEEAERLEAERLEAERAEAERLEAERLEAERVAAEEAARAEAERLEAERLEAERLEAERLEAERVEAERLEAERLAAEEAARAEAERLEAERLEAERLAAEEAARAEAERLEAERLEAERLEAERLEAERLEAERLEAERLEAERLAAEEAARAEAERLEAERLEAERVEAERLEAERLAAEGAARVEAERLEAERLEAERVEAERIAAEEAARAEAERLEAERVEAERLEAERVEAERLEAERVEAERLEAERLEAERLEAERLEAERLEAERIAAEETARNAQLEATQAAAKAAMQAQATEEALDPSHLASANAMLSEFSRSGATELATGAEDELDDEDDEPASTIPEPIVQRDLTDTASLLRELSSLGFEDDGPSRPAHPPTRPATPPRPVTPSASPKKKKGLFGR